MNGLNLLSPIEKTSSLLLWKYIIIKNVILIILTLSVVVASVLFSAKLILMKKLAEVQAETQLTNITQSKVNQKVNTFNSKIKTINEIQNNFIVWSDLLYAFNNLITPGIKLQSTDININDSTIIIKGTAATRDDLLTLRDSLSSCSLINNINLPLNTLLKKQNVNFTLVADIILDNKAEEINCLQ